MSEQRFTLAAPASLEVTIRKSRFVAHAAPVSSEAEAAAFLETASDGSASHNCWAWRIGQQYRFNDDGEPGGSAGRPILAAIEGQDMDRVAVVVTRWFGGIKLGVGGLVRAYGGTAAECMRQAKRIEIIAMTAVRFSLDYTAVDLFKARTRDWPIELLAEDYGAESVQISLRIANDQVAALCTLVTDLSRGQSQLVTL